MTGQGGRINPMSTEAATISEDLVQGLSSWERILVTRELGTRLPGCTETLTTPAGNGGEIVWECTARAFSPWMTFCGLDLRVICKPVLMTVQIIVN